MTVLLSIQQAESEGLTAVTMSGTLRSIPWEYPGEQRPDVPLGFDFSKEQRSSNYRATQRPTPVLSFRRAVWTASPITQEPTEAPTADKDRRHYVGPPGAHATTISRQPATSCRLAACRPPHGAHVGGSAAVVTTPRSRSHASPPVKQPARWHAVAAGGWQAEGRECGESMRRQSQRLFSEDGAHLAVSRINTVAGNGSQDPLGGPLYWCPRGAVLRIGGLLPGGVPPQVKVQKHNNSPRAGR